MELLYLGVIIAAFVLLMVMQTSKRKKEEAKATAFIDTLRMGNTVITYSGIIGKIKEIKEVGLTKEVVLETGNDKNKSYFTVDINAIMDLDRREEMAAAEKARQAAKVNVATEDKKLAVKDNAVADDYVQKRNKTVNKKNA